MRVMIFVKATESSEEGFDFSTPEALALMEAMGKFNEELIKAGIMKDEGDCGGLKPSSYGKRVAFNGTDRTVISGPFENSRELVTGYWIWEVKDMDEAVQWVKRCPNPMPVPSEIEIRPFFGCEDFE
ncbi:MAG: YciI family protein [Alphaproteobacteria bacterium]|nr:YciI family protein [Alphaproteobacteria bacterium]